jgi:hypothetical protein
MKIQHIQEVVCPVCGKIFIPGYPHAYKDRRSPYKRVCTWGCVMKSERLKEANRKRKSRKRVKNG